MRRLLPALLLAGCLQGGSPELDGTWYAKVSGCTEAVIFGPGDAYQVDVTCGASTDSSVGTYAVDGDVLRIVGADTFDLRWGFGEVADTLLLERDGLTMILHRRAP